MHELIRDKCVGDPLPALLKCKLSIAQRISRLQKSVHCWSRWNGMLLTNVFAPLAGHPSIGYIQNTLSISPLH